MARDNHIKGLRLTRENDREIALRVQNILSLGRLNYGKNEKMCIASSDTFFQVLP